MHDSDTIRLVRQEIKRQLITILSGQAGANDQVETETIDNMYPGSPSIPDRPVMHPYGFASRAPVKTIGVTGRQGDDPTNRIVLGHRDSKRPKDIGAGDVVIYSHNGTDILTRVDVSNDKGFKIKTKFGFWEWDAVSDMNFDTGTVQGEIGHGGKVKLTNEVGEMVALISELFDKLLEMLNVDVQTGTTATMLGPQLLVMPQLATKVTAFQASKLKLDSFKA